MYRGAFRPENPEEIIRFLEPTDDFPERGIIPKQKLVLESQFDLSMHHAWRSLGYFGLTRRLKGDHRSLRRGSVHHASMLIGAQPQHVAVTLDGIKYDDTFEDIEPSNEGTVYSTCFDPIDHVDSIVSSAIFSYLNQQDFASNPYEEEIRGIQDEFYKKAPLDLVDLQQKLAIASARRKEWGV